MKNTSKVKTIVSLVGIVAVSLMGCTSGGGSSSSTTTPATTLSGAVAKGYVAGARVICDKVVEGSTNGNLVFDRDNGEVYDLSDENGAYRLDVPADYGDCVLVSLGGTIAGTGQAAPPMIAPKDAKNITPVTTLVSLNSSLKDKIGTDYDQDIANPAGANAAVVALAMVAKTALDCLDTTAPLTDNNKVGVMTKMANSFANVTDLKSPTEIGQAINTAITAALADASIIDPEVIQYNNDIVAAAIQTAVQTVVETIDPTNNTTVVEDTIKDAVETVITEKQTTVESAVTKMTKINVGDITLKDANSGTIATILRADKTKTLTEAQADEAVIITATLLGTNTYDVAKTYATASGFVMDISDLLSLREATATISGVSATIDPSPVVGEAVLHITLSADAAISIAGTDSLGNAVSASFANDSNIATIASNVLTLDLGALDAKVKATIPATDALFDIGSTGNFQVKIFGANLPLAETLKTITVN